ncbi:MAG: hypothetical protein PVG84_11325 [Desulfobacterales bacterium]
MEAEVEFRIRDQLKIDGFVESARFVYRSRIKSGMTDPVSRTNRIYWIPATGSSPAQASPE